MPEPQEIAAPAEKLSASCSGTMVLAGTFDRHPKLKIVIGHMGEALPVMMDRCDAVFARQTGSHLTRTISKTITDQVWITTSGFFSLAPFTAAMMKFGADRILFSVDYPFSPNAAGRKFLDALPVSAGDLEKIAFRNADALLNPGSSTSCSSIACMNG